MYNITMGTDITLNPKHIPTPYGGGPMFVNQATVQTQGGVGDVLSSDQLSQTLHIRNSLGVGSGILNNVQIAPPLASGCRGSVMPKLTPKESNTAKYIHVNNAAYCDGLYNPPTTPNPKVKEYFIKKIIGKPEVIKASYYSVKTSKEHDAVIAEIAKKGTTKQIVEDSPMTGRQLVAHGDAAIYKGSAGSKIMGMDDGAVAMIGGSLCHTTWKKEDDLETEVAWNKNFFTQYGYESWGQNLTGKKGAVYTKRIVPNANTFYDLTVSPEGKMTLMNSKPSKKAAVKKKLAATWTNSSMATIADSYKELMTTSNLDPNWTITGNESGELSINKLVTIKEKGKKEKLAASVINMDKEGNITINSAQHLNLVSAKNVTITSGEDIIITSKGKTLLTATKDFIVTAKATMSMAIKGAFSIAVDKLINISSKLGISIFTQKNKADTKSKPVINISSVDAVNIDVLKSAAITALQKDVATAKANAATALKNSPKTPAKK